MDTALWVLQWVVGVLFVLAGLNHALAPFERLGQSMAWTAAVGNRITRLVGITEQAGGLGVVLPGLFDIAPWLVPVAGLGLALQMSLGVRLHLQRKEAQGAATTAVLGLLALAVAVGRFIEPL